MAEITFRGYRLDMGLVIVFSSVFILLIWVILKLLRVIQTPLIFELMPVITGLSAVFGLGISIGKILQIIRQLQDNDRKIVRELELLTKEHIMLKADVNHYNSYGKNLTY
jgi:hypothetical protein